MQVGEEPLVYNCELHLAVFAWFGPVLAIKWGKGVLREKTRYEIKRGQPAVYPGQ